MDFWTAFCEQVELRKDRRGRRIVKRINAIRSEKRREKAIAWLERKSRSHMESVGALKAGASWNSVGERNWDKFFESLSKFIAALLPILLQILPFLISLPWWLVAFALTFGAAV